MSKIWKISDNTSKKDKIEVNYQRKVIEKQSMSKLGTAAYKDCNENNALSKMEVRLFHKRTLKAGSLQKRRQLYGTQEPRLLVPCCLRIFSSLIDSLSNMVARAPALMPTIQATRWSRGNVP